MKYFKILNVAIIIVTLVSCGQNNEYAEEKVLNVLTWSDYFGSTTLETFTNETGIRVQVDYIDSNEDLITKIENQPDQYDIIVPSTYAVDIMIQKNLLRSIRIKDLKNYSNLAPEFSSVESGKDSVWSIPYTVSFTAIGINKSKFNSNLSGYDDFFRADIGKSILLLDDMRATIGMALKSLGYSINSTDERSIDEAVTRLKSISDKIHIFASADLQQLIASGEVDLSYAWSGDIFQASRINNDVQLVVPEEGTILYIDRLAIPREARHESNALRFIDHILLGKVAAEISNEILYLAPNTATVELLSDEARGLWDLMITLAQNSKFEQIRYIGGSIDLYVNAWNEVRLK